MQSPDWQNHTEAIARRKLTPYTYKPEERSSDPNSSEMAAAAHLRGHVVFNSASNARRHTQAPAPSLSRGRLPTARKPPVAACQRHGVGTLELDGGATRRPAPRFLCLHGFRTSGEIMRRQVADRWPADVTSRLDLAFADAPFPAEGDSPVRGVFDPPYYEWCHFVGEVSPASITVTRKYYSS